MEILVNNIENNSISRKKNKIKKQEPPRINAFFLAIGMNKGHFFSFKKYID